jgi:hypothetical protein
MTKEEKAEQYSKRQYGLMSGISSQKYESFIAGYECAEQANEEMMCKFAEWMKSATFRADGVIAFSTPKELVELFKQSLKQ